jgi:hypothetical protein
MNPQDQASLTAYYNCLNATGSGFGGIANMITAFASGDVSAFVQSLSQAEQISMQNQGCMGLLTPAMKNMMIRAQQHSIDLRNTVHPSVGK